LTDPTSWFKVGIVILIAKAGVHMTTVFLYTFLFSTWGLGLLSWIVGLGHLLTKWNLESMERALDIEQKKALFEKFESVTSSRQGFTMAGQPAPSMPSKDMIPEKIKELMKSSPNHPEVEEIDSDDQILGVRFEAENYPPGFGDGDEDE
jgi:hypothetical protein